MKLSRHCLSTCAMLLACGISIQAQAVDKVAQLVRVGPTAEYPLATAVFGGKVYFISNGYLNSYGGLYKLVLDNATGKDKAVLVHKFIPYNTSTYAGQAGENPVGLTVGTVGGTSVLIVTTGFGGVNGDGGQLILTASSKQELSFPSGFAPVGASIADFSSAGATSTSNTKTGNPRLPGGGYWDVPWSTTAGSSQPADVDAAKMSQTSSPLEAIPAGITVGSFSTIFTFPGGAGGQHPGSPGVQGADGNFYGTTEAGGSTTNGCPSYGCGVVYQLTPPASGKTLWHEHVLYTGGNDPQFNDFYAPVTFDSNGNVYGTAAFGGSGSGGVFMLKKQSTYPWPLTTLYTFPPGEANGAVPETAVVLDTNGNLYGTAAYGGNGTTNLYGVAFELLKSATFPWNEKILQYFHGGTTQGGDPSGALLLYLGGIYGTTYGGGLDGTTKCPGNGAGQEPPPGCGTVFELTPR